MESLFGSYAEVKRLERAVLQALGRPDGCTPRRNGNRLTRSLMSEFFEADCALKRHAQMFSGPLMQELLSSIRDREEEFVTLARAADTNWRQVEQHIGAANAMRRLAADLEDLEKTIRSSGWPWTEAEAEQALSIEVAHG
jgi:hypothetical protein